MMNLIICIYVYDSKHSLYMRKVIEKNIRVGTDELPVN